MASKVQIDFVVNGIETTNLQLKKINGNIAKTAKSSINATKSISLLGDTLKTAAKSAIAFTAGFLGFSAIRGAINTLVEFEEAVAEVETILTSTAFSTRKLQESLIDASAQFGTSAREQAKTFYQIISAGVTDVTKAQEVLIASNKLAIGGLTSTTQAVDIITTAINAYSDGSVTAEKAADALFTAVRLGKTRVDELASSLGIVLPIASSVGVTFEEVAGAIAQLTKRGISTNLAVTQLRSLLSSIIQNQGEANKTLGNASDAFSLAALKAKGLTKFLVDLNKATKGSEEQIFKLVGRKEALTGFLSLASDGFKGLDNSIKQVTSGVGASNEAFKRITDTIGAQWRILKSTISAIVLKVNLNQASAIVGILKRLNAIVETVKNNINSFLNFMVATFFTGVSVVLVKTAIAFKVWAATVKTSMATAIIATRAFKAAISFGVLLVIDLAIFKILEFRDQFLSIKDTATFVFNKIKILGLQFSLVFQKAFLSINKAVFNFVKTNKVAQKVFGTNSTFIKSLVRDIKDQKQNVVALTEKIKNLNEENENFKKTSKETKEEVEKLNQVLLKAATKSFADAAIAPSIRGVKELNELLFDTEKLFTGLTNKSGKKITIEFATVFKDLITSVKDGAAGAEKLLSAGIATAAEKLVPGLGKIAGPLFDALSGGPEKVKKFTQEFTRAIPQLVENFILAIPVFLEEFAAGMGEVFERLAERADIIAARFIVALVNASPRIAVGLAKSMPLVGVALVKEMPNVAKSFGESLINEGKRFIDAIVDGIKDALKGFGGVFGGAGGGIGGFVSSIGSALGFAKGGLVRGPSGVDRVPAMLTAGEYVVPKGNAQNAQAISDGSLTNEVKQTNALLKSLIGAVSNGQTVESSLSINEDAFANIILKLNRNNARLSA